ncbi:hypothetical protein RhiirA4_548017 [Rhizophagus irregularis]|uniref:F-box domain-containing protein n=1 Tax=Rhizophagus irregularis TaxID=588596 RepID=A0A2I1H5D6_9GLOM|nr:hypothetical protein RhiirA4_548017 [Rhizophagus irregularis]
MVPLVKNVLFIILEEFKGDKNSLHSCLLVNKTWCEIIVPMLWKNPWKYLEEDEKEKSQLNILKTRWVPFNILANSIENTKDYLIEISVYDKYYEGNNKRLIQSIYQKCLNLKYQKFSIKKNDILEFNKLLIICQNLIGLFVHDASIEGLNSNSSPNNLYKFKFEFNYN